MIVSYVRRVNKSGKVVEKIMGKYKDSRYCLKRYFAYQLYLKTEISTFTSKNILHLIITFCNPSSTIFSIDEQRYYNMICRAVIGHYLNTDGPLKLLTSKKDHKTMKVDHFRIYRFILNDLKHYYQKRESKIIQ